MSITGSMASAALDGDAGQLQPLSGSGRMWARVTLPGHRRMDHELSDPETWLTEHGDALYRYALRHTGDPARAEDLVQDTLIAALQARSGFAGKSRERTWLTGILKHKVIDHLRIRDREIATDLASEPHLHDDGEHFDARGFWQVEVRSWSNPAGALQEEAFFDALEHCVEALPERTGEAFRMREVHGMDTDAICAALDIGTANNLFVILSRARMSLRDCLARTWFATERQEQQA